jgi:hypothetical protein
MRIRLGRVFATLPCCRDDLSVVKAVEVGFDLGAARPHCSQYAFFLALTKGEKGKQQLGTVEQFSDHSLPRNRRPVTPASLAKASTRPRRR